MSNAHQNAILRILPANSCKKHWEKLREVSILNGPILTKTQPYYTLQATCKYVQCGRCDVGVRLLGGSSFSFLTRGASAGASQDIMPEGMRMNSINTMSRQQSYQKNSRDIKSRYCIYIYNIDIDIVFHTKPRHI